MTPGRSLVLGLYALAGPLLLLLFKHACFWSYNLLSAGVHLLSALHSEFLLASFISDWYRSRLLKKLKAAGFKRRPFCPPPPPLTALPSRLMVLSAVMLSMWSVAMASPLPVPGPPPTWVSCWAGVCGRKTLKKPPDPGSIVPDGEGCVYQCFNQQPIHHEDASSSTLLLDPEEWFLESEGAGGMSVPAAVPCTSSSCGFLGGMFGSAHSFNAIHVTSWESTAIVDSGASMTISPHLEDFESISYNSEPAVLTGVSKGCPIVGQGTVSYLLETSSGPWKVSLPALYVPDSVTRLLCPQDLRKKYGCNISFVDDGMLLQHQGKTTLWPYERSTNLPVAGLVPTQEAEGAKSALTAEVTTANNLNLTAGQKELLKWHYKFGHLGFKVVQSVLKSGAVGQSPVIKAASNCSLPKCSSCAYGKARQRPRATNVKETKALADKILSKEQLYPGQKVSMDHFVVTTPGRLFTSYGNESFEKQFKGGIVFKDHASSYTHVEPVVNFTASEAIRAKRVFERDLASMGVTVLTYHSDQGVFTASQFQDELLKRNQVLSYSGTGAQHQNAVAERAIGVIVATARTMMLHAKLRWPDAVKTNLWPMAMKHAQHLWNHIPRENNVCPMDLITRSTVPRNVLKDLHVWGSPCFVLDPKLQSGAKIPKWDPRSTVGMNLGYSPKHASTVPLVLNVETGAISSQFHLVFDDLFTTVSSDSAKDQQPLDHEEWNKLLDDGGLYSIVFDETEDEDEAALDWLAEAERLHRHQQAVAQVPPPPPVHDPDDALSVALPPQAVAPPDGNALPQREQEPQVASPSVPMPEPVVEPSPIAERPLQREQVPLPPMDTRGPKPPRRPPKTSPQRAEAANQQPTLRRSSRVRRPVARYVPTGTLAALMSTSHLDIVGRSVGTLCGFFSTVAKACVGDPLASAGLEMYDEDSGTFNVSNPVTFYALLTASRKAGKNPDLPMYHQAMSSAERHKWVESMNEEIKTLESMDCWEVVPRSNIGNSKVIKCTWAFRLKRRPDGSPYKYKARLCLRGDTMVKGEDYTESFSPVVQWSSVRVMLILSIVHGLHTRQVDYVNAFAQADQPSNKIIYMEFPPGYTNPTDDCVLRLKKTLYGAVDSPLHFFRLLKSNLEACGFKQLEHIDPCVFVHPKMICLTYVDDCLWFSADEAAMDNLIARMKQKMDLKIESNDVSSFLGIQFTRRGSTIELKQTGLIDKVLAETGMKDCNSSEVPAAEKTLGKDPDGEAHEEHWSYASVVGMLLYLAGNSRPDICFAVHQCARFTHAPKKSHTAAIKRIVRYLKGTRNRGLVMQPSGAFNVDCYVDADFCGLWGSEDPEDPTVAKSRTGYLLTLAGCPLLWVSKLQTEVSVSTMMAEYVALSTAMRDMLPLKRMIKAVAKVVTGDSNVTVTAKSEVFEDNMGALTVATCPRITPQSKFFAVKYHFFREHVKTEANPDGEIHIKKIDTKDQLADILTKGLVAAKFQPLRDRLMGWDLNMNPRVSWRI